MIKIFQKIPHSFRRDAIVVVKMLLPVVFLIGAVASFHEFVIHAVMANLAINGLIIAAASYGVVLILVRLFAAQEDFRVIERFGYEAGQGVYMTKLLEEPWLKRRYVRNYLAHIAQTGGTLSSQLDQNAIESELHALSAEYESKMELPQFLVGFMIAMGLLGTFIGLLKTLTGISSMLDGMGTNGANVEQQFMELIAKLREPLEGMGTAFSASMFGLVTSLMLAIMMINLRRYISRVMACARNVMHELIELSRGPASASAVKQLSPDDISMMAASGNGPGATYNLGDSGIQDLIGQSHDASRLVATRVDSLTKKLEVLFQSFEASIQSTRNLNELLGFGPRMKETGEKTLDELKVISAGQVEQQRIFHKLIDVNANMVRIASNILEAQSINQTEQQKVAQRLATINNDMIRMVDGLMEAQSSGRSEQQRSAQKVVDSSNDIAAIGSQILEAQRQAQAELSQLFKGLGDRVGGVETSNIGASRHLWEIKENFMKLSTSLGMVESISSGVGEQSLLLETLVKEARNTQRVLLAIQQDLRQPPPQV